MHTFPSPHLLLITTAIISLCFFSPPVHSHNHPLRNLFSSASVVLEVIESEGDELSLCYGVDLPSSCPVKCFIADPVCGIDGVTYWCGCADAACAGTRVSSRGFCPMGDVVSGPVSGQALLLVHIVWLILVGILVVLGVL